MSECAGCHRKILWGETPEGKRIPIDTRPPVYRVLEPYEPGYVAGHTIVERMDPEKTGVIHFATCPEARQFSGRNRKPEQQQLLPENVIEGHFDRP